MHRARLELVLGEIDSKNIGKLGHARRRHRDRRHGGKPGAVRNGDAHLKNFGILYADVDGAADLAPVYDVVTTTAYIPKDAMALTLGGSTHWPDRRRLIQLGQTRADLSLRDIEAMLEAIADAMASVATRMRTYFRQHAPEIGERMSASWEIGIKDTLGFADRTLISIARRGPATHSRRSGH